MGPRVVALATLTLACALVLWPPRPARQDLRIIFIDVGQGDAILVQTPRGHTIMIDTGGRLERGVDRAGESPAEEVGERIVVPFLIRSGIHHLDAIIISHPHGDHENVKQTPAIKSEVNLQLPAQRSSVHGAVA